MSYSKTTWATGDTITAQLLNHAEDGIAANDAAIASAFDALQITLTNEDDAIVADKTYAEILAAFNAGTPCIVTIEGQDSAPAYMGMINGCYTDNSENKILTMTNVASIGVSGEVFVLVVNFAPSGITSVYGTMAYTT